MGWAQLPPAMLTHVLMKSLNCISSASSPVNSLSQTHTNSHETALNHMHPELKPFTVAFLWFSHVPAFRISAASIFQLAFSFVAYLSAFRLLFLTISFCSLFSFCPLLLLFVSR